MRFVGGLLDARHACRRPFADRGRLSRRPRDLLFNFDAIVDVLGLHAECDVADVPYGQFERAGGFAAGLEDESVFLLVGKSFLFEERDS